MRAEDTTVPPPHPTRRRDASVPILGVLGAVAVLVGTGLVAVALPPGVAAGVVGQLVVAGLLVPTGVLCLRAARVTRGRWSTGWRLLGSAGVLWAAANLVTVVSVWLPGRGIYLGIYPLQSGSLALVVAALVVLPRPRWRPSQALRAWLDVVVVASVGALLASLSVVRSALDRAATGVDAVAALGYGAAALVMLGLAYELGRRHVYPPRPELAVMSAGFVCWVVAAGAYATDPSPLVAPAWISWLVGVGTVLLASSALRVLRRAEDDDEVGTLAVRVVLWLPDAAVVVGVVTVIVTGLPDWPQQTLGAVVALLVVVRHVVVTADARRFHLRVEREVGDRTADLRDWTQRYATILDTVGDGIVSTDADGRIVFVNSSARDLLGAGPGELAGLEACAALCTVRHLDDCPFDAAHRGLVLAGVDGELRRRDGAVVPVELHAAPQPGGAGAVIAFRDVSARLAVEQVKRQFVSSVSHELRTPLTSVRGVLEMMVDGEAGELNAVGRSLAANASRGVERLSRLVDDIIDAEKLATGQFRVDLARTPLSRVLHDTAAALAPYAAAVEVSVVVEDHDEHDVWGDADRIEQALTNLVGNAVKFSPRGGVVRVDARPHHDAGVDAVLVRVRDEGPGLPADQLERVFERFHQVTGDRSVDQAGTGLGLTITRSIVLQHGGRVWAESTPGEGATFCFTLPLAPVRDVGRESGRRGAR